MDMDMQIVGQKGILLVEVDDKVTSYMQELSEIRAMEDAIRVMLSDIFNYIQCTTEESASERQSDQIGE